MSDPDRLATIEREVALLRTELAEVRKQQIDNQVEVVIQNINSNNPALRAALRRRARIEGGPLALLFGS